MSPGRRSLSRRAGGRSPKAARPTRPGPFSAPELEVTIESLAFGGDGVAHAPRAIFVPGAAPGDRLRVRVVESRASWARAEIAEMIEPSPLRRDPPCPYASRCGGCQWQHVGEETQAAAKRRAVEDALRRIGGFPEISVPPLIAAGPPLRYRRRIRFRVRRRGDRTITGFLRPRSAQVVDVEACVQMTQGLERAYRALRSALGAAGPAGGVEEIELAVGSDDAAAVAAFHLPVEPKRGERTPVARLADALVRSGALQGWAALSPDGRILDAGGEVTLTDDFPEGSVPGAPFTLRRRGWAFSQASFEANLALVRTAVEALGDPFPRRVLDLYAGSGNFTLPLSSLASDVVAVEEDADAARELRDNLAAAGRRAHVIAGDVKDALRDIGAADAVLLDPPRTGAADAVPFLLAIAPRRIVYVSCHPATLARDLARLAEGGYRLTDVRALDLFPQTYHVEAVATCIRENA
jgi:23S rRNA (uracil1939-C5)-methyltransferase